MAGKVVKQLAGSGTGQSFSDMVSAMKHTLSGSMVDKIICKATTEECTPPKRKHLTYLVRCTFEPRLSILDFANHIVSRTKHTNSIVVFKALITIHHLMQYGSERFLQYFASDNLYFNDHISNPDTSIARFIIPYATYLEERAASYRSLAFDLCRVKLGKEDGFMRQLQLPKLFNAIPVMERQLDSLLQFEANRGELNNPLLKFAHLHMYRDLIRLYAVLNEVMINLIGKYFTMSKRDCRIALSAYKSFLKRMDNINDFIKLSEVTDSMYAPVSDGLTSGGFVFQPVPPAVLEALESHLAVLEGHKQSESKTVTQQQQKLEDSGASDASSFHLPAVEQQRIIEEERRRLESYVTNARQRAVPLEEKEADCMAVSAQSSCADLVGDLLSSDDQQVLPVTNAFHPPTSVMQPFAYPQSSPTMMASYPSVPPVSVFGLPNNHPTHQQYQPSLASVPAAMSPSMHFPPVVYGGQSMPSTTNMFIPQHPTASLNPFLAQSASTVQTVPLCSSTNPFLPIVATSTTGTVASHLCPAASASVNHIPQSVATVNGNLPSQQLCHNSNGGDKSSMLTNRLAELVDSLSISSSSYGQSTNGGQQQQLPYRAPDSNRTAVNWTSTPFAEQLQQQQPIRKTGGDGFALGQTTVPTGGGGTAPSFQWSHVNLQNKPVGSGAFTPMNSTPSLLQQPQPLQPAPATALASGQSRSSTNPFVM